MSFLQASYLDNSPTSCITRNGFEFAFDRFYALPGSVERVDGDILEDMFIPTQTHDAKKKLRENRYFALGQLKHYGIAAEAQDLTGTGARFLKKQLLAGKCDKVPDHIENLRQQMAEEWWNKLPPHLLANHSPSRFVKKYFLNGIGAPDSTKTPEPMVLHDMYSKRKLRAAIDSIPGLCFRSTGHEPNFTFFVGWSISAVDKAIRMEAEAKKQAEEDRRRQRREEHEDYVRKSRTNRAFLVGRYLVECEFIARGWPDSCRDGDMEMSVKETGEPGLYEASVDFRVFEAAMLLGDDKSTLRDYAEAHSGNEFSEDEEGGYDDSSECSDSEEDADHAESETGTHAGAAGTKWKTAPQIQGGLQPKKKSHESAGSTSLDFQLLLRGRETGEGEIFPDPGTGRMRAGDLQFVSFTGKVDIACVGKDVVFTALKVSDTPGACANSWEDFSESQYERARVGRWH